jgi:hypothetical protein
MSALSIDAAVFSVSGHLNRPAGSHVMSHSEALCRLTVADTRSDMIQWALGGATDRIEGNPDASHRRNKRVARLLGAATLVCGFGLTAPVAAQVSVQPADVNPYTLTPMRVIASGAAATGLIGAVIGGLALARSGRRIGTGNGRRGAVVALVLGPIALVIGGLVVATADGGLGTGNGLAGGAVAMMVGLVGMGLGGLALSRSRRTA